LSAHLSQARRDSGVGRGAFPFPSSSTFSSTPSRRPGRAHFFHRCRYLVHIDDRCYHISAPTSASQRISRPTPAPESSRKRAFLFWGCFLEPRLRLGQREQAFRELVGKLPGKTSEEARSKRAPDAVPAHPVGNA